MSTNLHLVINIRQNVFNLWCLPLHTRIAEGLNIPSIFNIHSIVPFLRLIYKFIIL